MVEKVDVKSEEIQDDGFDFPADYDVLEMVDEIPLDQELPTVTERYFTPYYRVDVQRPGNDVCIQVHSNRICMLTLAPSHPVLRTDCKIEKISFKVTEKVDRAANEISGKGKHGAQALQETSNICFITCSDGETWQIKCCMSGKLVEVNQELLVDPSLVKKPTHQAGYIAIILPNLQVHEAMKKQLLSQTDYDRHVANRQNIDESLSESAAAKRLLEDPISPAQKDKIQKIE